MHNQFFPKWYTVVSMLCLSGGPNAHDSVPNDVHMFPCCVVQMHIIPFQMMYPCFHAASLGGPSVHDSIPHDVHMFLCCGPNAQDSIPKEDVFQCCIFQVV